MISTPHSFIFERNIKNPNSDLLNEYKQTVSNDHKEKSICENHKLLIIRKEVFLKQIMNEEHAKVEIIEDVLETINSIQDGLDSNTIKDLLISLQKKEKKLMDQISNIGNEDSDHTKCIVSGYNV